MTLKAPTEAQMGRFMFLLGEYDSTMMPIFISGQSETDWKRLFDTLSEEKRRWLTEKAGLDAKQKKEYGLK